MSELIPCYYTYEPEENQIYISAKDYVDQMDQYADGSNKNNKNQPYNYFYEINDAMWSIDCPEDAESVFDTNGKSLEYIIKNMKAKGFELIKDPDV